MVLPTRDYVEPLVVGDLVGFARNLDLEPEPITKMRKRGGEIEVFARGKWHKTFEVFYCPSPEQIESKLAPIREHHRLNPRQDR